MVDTSPTPQRSGTPTGTSRRALPPGQRRLDGFPRFGTHLHRPPPRVPDNPVIEITGAVTTPVTVPAAGLATMSRVEVVADFHCVSGWSATDLRWGGVAFRTFFGEIIAPVLQPGATITHLVFGGLDGFESAVLIEDVMRDNVLIADQLDGRPLTADHGAPVRLISPDQYGYINTKHLCEIRVLTAAPEQELGAAHPVSKVGLRGPLVKRHPRARVWEEERHPDLSARFLRPLYRLVIKPGIWLAARGIRRGDAPPT